MSEETDEVVGPEWITPSTEKDKENPQSFKVRGLDPMEALDITSEMKFEDGALKVSGRAVRAALRQGVMDAKGRGFEKGFERQLLNTVATLTLQEVGMKIINKTKLSEAEAKN